MSKKILVVNYKTGNVDSVIKAIKVAGYEVIFSSEKKDFDNVSKIVLPGQGAYDYAMNQLNKLDLKQKIIECAQKGMPILGICLGFQLILQEEGARISRQDQVLHGVETDIEIIPESKTYKEIGNPLRVARYHSLQVHPDSLDSLNETIKITARDPLRKTPLSFEDLDRKLFGLQYHPESFLTNQGKIIIQNIRHACVDNIGRTDQTS